jgi:formamidopyrimidine-DNA glycosylase
VDFSPDALYAARVPEYPDVVVYVERLRALAVGHPLSAIRLGSPFVLRTADPPPASLHGRVLGSVERLGKRLVLGFPGGGGAADAEELFLVVHLMIAGRLRWKAGKTPNHRAPDVLAVFDFPHGSVVFTEASKKKRASLHVVRGRAALADFDRGGLDPFAIDEAAFAARMRSERHTVKRSLTDPTLFSGIGNAYSDEILFHAKLSPVKLSTSLGDDELARLFASTRAVLAAWTDRFRAEVGDGFPDKVTAFRPEMAVHGKYREPCPVCGSPVQRIVHADNESNYCATCQTEGRLLADRALSRLLKDDWPRTLEELEERRRGAT